jgi:hypothetical protein
MSSSSRPWKRALTALFADETASRWQYSCECGLIQCYNLGCECRIIRGAHQALQPGKTRKNIAQIFLGVGCSGWMQSDPPPSSHSSQLPNFLGCVFHGWRWLEGLVCPTYQLDQEQHVQVSDHHSSSFNHIWKISNW